MAEFQVIDNTISINKHITELDLFVLGITNIIEKYANYVIISGYVSIFFGRARATEDVDMFLEQIPFDKFLQVYNEMISKGYEFTEDDASALYNDYLKEGISINIWKKDHQLIRMEIKFALKKTQKMALQNKIKVNLGQYTLFMGNIEAQIAYKRFIAKSEKDMEDARHLEIVFKNINKERINYYKEVFEAEFNE